MNTDTLPLHLIFGTGSLACWTAVALRTRGLRVAAVNRSGARPALLPQDVPLFRADVADRAQAVAVARGAAVVYQALNPPYSQWEALFPALQAHTVAAAQQAGARYVAMENLYMLDSTETLTESSRVAPRSMKGRLRQQMHEALMALHRAGSLQVGVVRAASFYGPGVRQSTLGERVFAPLVSGGRPQLMMRADQPHSYAYIEDVGRAVAAVGAAAAAGPAGIDLPHAGSGPVWFAPHAPALTQGELIALASRQLGGAARPQVVPPWMLRLVGLFNADAKASIEISYQLQAPFVVDARKSEAALGLKATPVEEGLRRTLAWYTAQGPGAGAA